MTVTPALPRWLRSRGALLVAALFALGGMVLWGLFQAPRAVSPAAPAGVEWGVPSRPLRFASLNVLHLRQGMDAVAGEIRTLNPDFVLLQEVESRDVVGLAQALGMQRHHHPNNYERSANLGGPKATWGNVILAKHPLYDAGPIPGSGGGSAGVWATTVVDGTRFIVATVHLSATPNADPQQVNESDERRSNEIASLLDAWRERNSPPIVVGGDFNQVASGNNYAVITDHLVDALAKIANAGTAFRAPQPRTDHLFASPHWSVQKGGAVERGAVDHRLFWIQLAGAGPPGNTMAPRARRMLLDPSPFCLIDPELGQGARFER